MTPNQLPRLTIVMLLALVAFLQTAANAQDSDGLKWKFKANDAFEVALTQTTDIESKVEKRTKTVSNEMTLNMTWKVKSVDESGTGTLDTTLDSIQLEMNSLPNGATQAIALDTLSEEKLKGASRKLRSQLMPLMGATFEIQMSAQGEILKSSVPESTLEQLRQAPSSMRLRQLLSAEGFKELLGQSVVTFPNDVQPGKEWASTATVETSFGKVERSHTYTLKDRESGEISVLTKMKPLDSPGIHDPKLQSFEGGGRLEFDPTAGHFRFSEMSNQMTVEKPYREKTITTKVTSKLRMKMTKK